MIVPSAVLRVMSTLSVVMVVGLKTGIDTDGTYSLTLGSGRLEHRLRHHLRL